MHLLSAIVGLVLMAAPPDPAVTRALDTLKGCEALKSRPCLAAAARLTNLGAEAIEPTAEAFEHMTTPGRVLAISVFASHDGSRATRALREIARDASTGAPVRTMAIGELTHRFADSDDRERITRTLLEVLGDDDPAVRAAAARALGNRPVKGNDRVIGALVEAAGDDDATVRREAVLSLGMSGDPAVGPTLVQALEDEVSRIRTAAADGLTFVKYPPSVEPLIEAISSSDAMLRRVAGEALVHQTGERFGEDYGLWREWYETNNP